MVYPLLPKEGDLTAYANKVRDLVNKDLSPQANNEAVKRKNEEYRLLLQETETFVQASKRIEEKYQKDLNDLAKTGETARMLVLAESYDEQMDNLIDKENQKSDLYKRLAKETLLLSRAEIREQIKMLENSLKDVTIPEDIKQKIRSAIGNLKLDLEIGADQIKLDALKSRRLDILSAIEKESKKATPNVADLNAELDRLNKLIYGLDPEGTGKAKSLFAQGLAENFVYLKGTVKDVAEGVSRDIGMLSSSFNELAQSLGGSSTQAGYALETIGQLTNVASSAASAVASFASGDIVGGITKTVSAVAGLFTIGKRVKEMNEAARKEVSDFYAQAIAGEREYQELLRKRERDEVKRGKNTYRAIVDELELLKKSSPEIQAAYDRIFKSLQGQQYVAGKDSKHGTWFRKAKTWDIMASLFGSDYNDLEKLDLQKKLTGQVKIDFDELKKLRAELDAAGIDVEQLQKQLSELLTGTSVGGLADGLSKLFENGKFAAEDFGKSFEEIMKTAIVNSFKYKLLEDGMQPFFEDLAKMFESGTPTEAEIAAMKKRYQDLGSEWGAEWEKWQVITGIKFEPSIDTSSYGSIAESILSPLLGNPVSNSYPFLTQYINNL